MNAEGAHARAEAAFVDLRPTRADIVHDVLDGLARTPKRLPSKYFYDGEGSRLFEAITQQPEYYLTRTELTLLEARMPQISRALGARVHVVEYGSGSGRKTELLLAGLREPVAYTPVEISPSALLGSVERLAPMFPAITMLPVCADFSRGVHVPPLQRAQRRLVFFPGSTLGNFADPDAVRLLASMRETMGRHGAALLGIDLDKDTATLEAAYNDAAGVTAEFTLNLLSRLNREIGTDFDLSAFHHRAVYSRQRMRIETTLVSQRAQTVHVEGQPVPFATGEAMQVEYSCKYDDAHFGMLAAMAGLRVTHGWNDDRDWFGLRLLQPA